MLSRCGSWCSMLLLLSWVVSQRFSHSYIVGKSLFCRCGSIHCGFFEDILRLCFDDLFCELVISRAFICLKDFYVILQFSNENVRTVLSFDVWWFIAGVTVPLCKVLFPGHLISSAFNRFFPLLSFKDLLAGACLFSTKSLMYLCISLDLS